MNGSRLLLAAILAMACAAPPPPPGDSAPVDTTAVIVVPSGPSGDQAWDKSIIDQLERDARRIAQAEGCRDAGGCATAPVGVKACGGPRGYLVYCVSATDTAALTAKLEELARAERSYNERYGIASTCEFREPPATALVGQTCRAAP